MKKLIYKISEEEKNRILGLHRKQVIIERSQNKKLLSESEIKILLREQQENEVEVLLNSLSENDPPEKWQQIIDKVEDLGEDVVTFIKKMKNKQLGKKFGNFLKNNFNRVKFKQAGDKIVSFFNKLTSAGIKEYSTGDDAFINWVISLDAVKLLSALTEVIVAPVNCLVRFMLLSSVGLVVA